MAARRLLIVMLVLLGISSVIAVVVPNPQSRDQNPPETGTTDALAELDEESEKQAAIPVERKSISLPAEGGPTRIDAKPGQRLIVTVDANRASQIEIVGLGQTAFADPYAPAVFDLVLPGEPGRFPVRQPDGEPVAVISTT
ncbi:MAG: hypothetical protein J0H98_04905 [Solirubrobacterales bacterium]|nr:hypothetical protein [Solirubrobacterales bacterium]